MDKLLAGLTESGDKDQFISKLTKVEAKLRNTNEKITASNRDILDYKEELKETNLYGLQEILKLNIKSEKKKLKRLRDEKRLLKGDVYTLTRPETKYLHSMEQINGALEANKLKTIRKDKIIPRVCAYLGGLLGALPATVLAIFSSKGLSIPLPVMICSTFLGSGGGTVLGLVLEKPFRRFRKKFF